MTVPKPPNFDAAAWTARLKEHIPKNSSGQTITVWDQLPPFIKWARTMRDVSNTHDIQLKDHKADLDAHGERLDRHSARLAVLEAQPPIRPFRRGVLVAWMFENGQFTTHQFAQKASTAGYAWAALELDDYNNAPRWPDFSWECRQKGVIPGIWVTEGAAINRTPADAEFAIAELEGPGDYDGIIAAIDGKTLPSCSLAVITNFNVPLVSQQGVPQPDKAKPLIDAGFTCITEAYLGDNPQATPDALDRAARVLGWGTSQPCFGVYNSPPSAYAKWYDWPGCDYLGEYVL